MPNRPLILVFVAVALTLGLIGAFLWHSRGAPRQPPQDVIMAKLPEPSLEPLPQQGGGLPEGYKPPTAERADVAALVDRRRPLNQRVPNRTDDRPLTRQGDIDALLVVLMDRGDAHTARNEAMLKLRRSPYQPRLAGKLIEILESPEETLLMREYAIQHLMYVAQDEASAGRSKQWIASQIAARLSGGEVKLRRAALRALTILADQRALEAAVRMFQDPKQEALLRREAVYTLGRFKAKSLIPSLRSLAADEQADVGIRIAAIAVLGDFKDEESRLIFQTAIKSDKRHLKSAGKVALKKLPPAP